MTTIIIGGGTSLRGSGLGEYIDSHDEVIRLTQYLNYQNHNDYGDKTTYHFLFSHSARYIKYDVDHFWRQERGFCEIPSEIWLAWLIWKKPFTEEDRQNLRERFKNYNVIVIDRFINRIRKKYETYNPYYLNMSSGLTAALVTIDKLEPKALELLGFDNFYRGESKKYSGGYEFEHHQSNTVTLHDLGKERQFLIDYATERGTKIIWEMLE